MSFFNQKEEVINIQFTRFGKRSLCKNGFQPYYYQFFDDDIIYNSEFGGVKEEQNNSQDRILNKTPRFKKSPHVSSANSELTTTEFLINSDDNTTKKNYSYNEQERVLLYPLSNCELNSEQAPKFILQSHGIKLRTDSKNFQHFSDYGIYKKIPQLESESECRMTRVEGIDISEEELIRMNNSDTFIDLKEDKITFFDKSIIEVSKEKIIISLEEYNSDYNLSNFELEIYEIEETPSIMDSSMHRALRGVKLGPVLKRIKNMDDINALFRITTDEDVEEVKTAFGQHKNWYRSEE